ncbi:hypothetical protein IOC57_24235 [Bacillus sp. SD075]|nr:hypothetical protein [Bacillus sp. SD075]MBO1000829.1 hypothetical protein [Bacillus sp. SD075]
MKDRERGHVFFLFIENDLDMEWVELLVYAWELGIPIEEIESIALFET